jgi:type II secretory pathway pseudopilin PulG
VTLHDRRRGFTWPELIVIVIVVGIALAVIIPAVMAVRAAAARANCVDNMKRLALAFHNYHDRYKRFPPSSTVSRDAGGNISAVDGWGFAVPLLPYMDKDGLYQTLDVASGRPLVEPKGARGTPHADALAMRQPDLICPAFRGSPYADPWKKTEALTNYKALGATHHESLSVASPSPLKPKYGETKKHPDGAFFPGYGLSMADFADGSSNTVMLVETIEPRFARWTVGAEAAVVGLAPTVEFALVENNTFIAPRGFTYGLYEDDSTIDPSYRTYLDWDYENFPYDGGDGSTGGRYGPSSRHSGGVVNHAFMDGCVRSLSPKTDVALYMFVLTRDGGDPAGENFVTIR